MPTYEYACKQCSHQLEVVQSFSDEALTECPQCQGQLRKIFGNVGIAFKGSGFYKNDSRGSSTKTAAPAAAETPASTPAASTDSTPVAKPAASSD